MLHHFHESIMLLYRHVGVVIMTHNVSYAMNLHYHSPFHMALLSLLEIRIQGSHAT